LHKQTAVLLNELVSCSRKHLITSGLWRNLLRRCGIAQVGRGQKGTLSSWSDFQVGGEWDHLVWDRKRVVSYA
jgi:hypothetical protein